MRSLVVFCVCVALAGVGAQPALTQYLYLDSNGDGIHSPADELKNGQSSIVSVYVDMGHDKDGSLQSCNSHTKSGVGGASIAIFSYDLILRVAEGTGTVLWGPYVDETGFSQFGKDESNPTDFKTSYRMDVPVGAVRTETLPPTLLKLGHITVTPESGAPVVVASSTSSLDPSYFTGFGTKCSASEYPNTYVLGTDWFDTDGIAGPIKGDAADRTVTALQVAPSPSRGGVAVSFTSPVQTVARVEIFDVSGRLIQRLPDTMVLRGVNTLRWDGKGGSGKSVASGVYFARIWVGGSERLERFVIAR